MPRVLPHYHFVPFIHLNHIFLYLRALRWRVFLDHHRLGLFDDGFRNLQIHIRVVKSTLWHFWFPFLSNRWLVCARGNFKVMFCLCEFVSLKQKAVIDMFWISDLGKNLVGFRPSTCAHFISLHVVCCSLIRWLKVILKVLRHLNRPIRRMPVLCFLRWFNFFVFRLLMQFWLDDRRLSSLCMLMGLLCLALYRVLEF